MKENITKGIITAVIAGLTAYFNLLAIPILILMCVMIADYLTGMAKAWIGRVISSKTGIIGIIKKICYLIVVACGVVVDWIVAQGLENVGITYSPKISIGLLVVIWLIINELISILENLVIIGVPYPKFLLKIANQLKISADKNIGEDE